MIVTADKALMKKQLPVLILNVKFLNSTHLACVLTIGKYQKSGTAHTVEKLPQFARPKSKKMPDLKYQYLVGSKAGKNLYMSKES